MSRGQLLLTLSSLAAGLALAAGPRPALAATPVVERPTSGGTYGYGVPEAAPYVGLRAVVHYVTSGPDAPPLNDDDHDGYPDYVELVSQAADTATRPTPGRGNAMLGRLGRERKGVAGISGDYRRVPRRKEKSLASR